MTITTYTKESSKAADRDSLEVFWGDGQKQWVKRSNGEGQSLQNDVKMNKYVEVHTYPGRSTYTISFVDPNRAGGILNINYPRSEDVHFYLSTRFTLLDLQFQGSNSSVQLLQPPIDVACVGQPFIHNPNAFDTDGDSIAYALISPLSAENEVVPNYLFPDQLLPGTNNQIFLDNVTGDFIWRFPPQQGEYNIAFQIKEYREGVLINTVIRDMQILVRKCTSSPPTIDTKDEICVVAGETIDLGILVDDIDPGQKVRLFATGGPLVVSNNAAELNTLNVFSKPKLESKLVWKTSCDHVYKEYYQIVLRAIDNTFGDTFGLATLKTIRIKVVAPEPEILSAVPVNVNDILLEWTSPYQCEVTSNDYFYGFSVWRKEQSYDYPTDTCNLEAISKNYRRVIFNTKQQANGKYFFIDKNLQQNTTYCYRIIAEFAFKTSSGNPYKQTQSIPSDEICLQLKRDIPLFVKASVDVTGENDGEISLRWTKPLLSDFDTLMFPGPYKTEVYRTQVGNNNYALIPGSEKISNFFNSWKDTSYTDVKINTITTQYDYQLKFYYKGNTEYKPIPKTNSLFLQILPSDQKNILKYKAITPWSNKSFDIYKKEASGNFVKIKTTNKLEYEDVNLENGKEYCYKVQSSGTYSIRNIETPIINFSQEVCNKPIDNVPPCPPILEVETICTKNQDTDNPTNSLTWTDEFNCQSKDIVEMYKIYYRHTKDSEYTLIDQLPGSSAHLYKHLPDSNSIAGCYAITAIDAKGNESKYSNEICVENCPVYELANTFTPNGDGKNDLFVPIKNYFISTVDMKVFNEWGNLVYKTQNPKINWDGTKNGKPLAEGTYYFKCRVFQKSSVGENVLKDLNGYINIIR